MPGNLAIAAVGWPEIHDGLARNRRDPDPRAYEALRVRVRAWARRDLWSRGWTAIEDVVEDTSADVVMNLGLAKSPDTFKGFVHGYYRNHLRRNVPRAGRPPVISLSDDLDVADPAGGGAEAPDCDEQELVRSALAALPDHERQAVALHDLVGLSHAQIGEILRVRETNARKIASRGRARMRRYLRERWADSPCRADRPASPECEAAVA